MVAFELQGGLLVEVAATEIPNNFESEHTAAAIHPQSGDLYLASYDTNGGERSIIEHFRATDGGRRFAQAETASDPAREFYGRTAKHSLTFTPDGSQLYATFGGEPMALLHGRPGHRRPDLAARRRRRPQPPQAAFENGFARSRRSLRADAPRGAHHPLGRRQAAGRHLQPEPGRLDRGRCAGEARDLVLTPGGGAGVLAGPDDVVMVERDRATGELRLLNATSQRPGHSVQPAGDQPRRPLRLRAGLGPLGLLPAAGQPAQAWCWRAPTPPRSSAAAAGEIRLAANGVDVLLLLSAGRPLLLPPLGRNRRAGSLLAARRVPRLA